MLKVTVSAMLPDVASQHRSLPQTRLARTKGHVLKSNARKYSDDFISKSQTVLRILPLTA